MKTAIVILNWNGKEYLERFLPALVASVQGMEAEIIIADNASTDSSLDFLRENYPEIRTLVFDRNYGFTGGYNKAFRALEADNPEYFLLINSDIEVENDWLYPLVEWMDIHSDCAACAPKIKAWQEDRRTYFEYAGAAGGYIDAYGYPFCKGRVMKRVEADTGQYDNSPGDVLWASGACLMFRSSVWKELKGLDERFFAHMEEIDLCWRARLMGYTVNVVPRSTVYHVGGGTLPQESPFKIFLNYRNNLLMLENNWAKTVAMRNMYEMLALLAPLSASTSDDVQNCLEVMADEGSEMIQEMIEDSARDGIRKARKKLRFRRFLDWCSSLVYLFTGHKDYYEAVRKAHREFRKLSKGLDYDEVEEFLSYDVRNNGCIARKFLDIDLNRPRFVRVNVKGLLDESIIILNYLQKEQVFEYLSRKI